MSWFGPEQTDQRVSGSPTSIDDPDPGPRAYRVIRLSPDGTVGEANILAARTDDEAKALAATLSNGHGIDLWERARYLASFPPHSALYPAGSR